MTVQVRSQTPLKISGEEGGGSKRTPFTAKVAFKENEKEVCMEMVKSLSKEQQEQAARTSFSYFMASTSRRKSFRGPSSDDREWMAMRMARRHLVAEKGDAKLALEKMTKTLQFREEVNIDGIRQCFAADTPDTSDHSLSELRSMIDCDTGCCGGVLTVRGYDNSNRAILQKAIARDCFNMEKEAFITLQLYWVERALACTERQSGGTEEKINICFDYTGYSKNKSPPLSLAIELTRILQDHYPERLNVFIVVDPPFLIRSIWKAVKPFLDPATKQKVKFVTGERQKENQLRPILSIDQAMEFMLPGGKLKRSVDMKHYLHDVPFDCTCDEWSLLTA